MIPELTDAQREVQALVREFCQREIAPHTAEWDAGHHVPLDTLRALAELGVLGVTIPEEHGGAGPRPHDALPASSRSSRATTPASRWPWPCTPG